MASVSLFSTPTDTLSTTRQASPASHTQPSAATRPAPGTRSQDDTVKLSETAQAQLLYKQGLSVSTIASTLGTSSTEIDTDLGITLDEEIQKALQSTMKA